MKKSKKWIALFLAALCTFTPLTAFAADVNIDRKPLQMDVSPTVINGRTMVPMRSIFEGLGAAVEWNSYTRGITAQKEDKTITLYLNEKNAFINGVSHSLDTPAVAVNGRTMVPVRFVAESLDCKVYWDSYNQLVSIFTDLSDTDELSRTGELPISVHGCLARWGDGAVGGSDCKRKDSTFKNDLTTTLLGDVRKRVYTRHQQSRRTEDSMCRQQSRPSEHLWCGTWFVQQPHRETHQQEGTTQIIRYH